MALAKIPRRTLEQIGHATWRTTVRRLRRGPRRPGWSFRYEAMVELLRIQFGVDAGPRRARGGNGGMKLDRMRKSMDAVGARELQRDRIVREKLELGGVPGVRVLPKRHGTTEPLPTHGTVLYLHGGGYVLGSTRSHLGLLGTLAHTAHTEVFAIDYRLAPEHPCPAGLEDAVAAYAALIRERDPKHVVIAGDSAGGGLTAATLCAIRDAGLPLPAGGVLISPWLDLTHASPAKSTRYDFIFPEQSEPARLAYGASLGVEDPRVSPVNAELHGLPPLLVLAGEVEAIVEDSVRFVERVRAAGGSVEWVLQPDEIHVYPMFADLSARAQSGMGTIARFIRKRTGG
ncbi:MAG: alpha/beta hydrolase [Sandaracinus sp.]|nr:alpha/beta hydrolase [Sandaracinus sp.]